MEDYEKIYWAGLQWGAVKHNIGKREFYLPKSSVPVTKSRLKSLELENHKMKLIICAFNAYLLEAKKILEDNQTLVSAGDQLSKLKSMDK